MFARYLNWVRAALAAVVLCGFLGNGQAQAQAPSPSAVAVARELVDIKGDSKVFDPVLSGIILKSRDALLQSNPMVSGDLNVVAQQLRHELAPRLEAVRNQVAVNYARRFTEKELKDVLAFYKSPLGTKLLAAEPQILAQSMGFANKWASDLADEVIAKMREEMRKKGHQL